MTINFIGHTPRRLFFCSTCLEMFLACYSLFQLDTSLFGVVPFFTSNVMSQNVLTFKFTINQLHVGFITKDCKYHYNVGQLKVGFVLQIGPGITKQNNFFKKVGQQLQSNAVQKTNERNRAEQQILATYYFIHPTIYSWDFLRS